MSRTIVVYFSKTGFSRRYAQWLAEDLDCRAVPEKERKALDWAQYDTVILTGGLYAGQMAGLKWLERQLPRMQGKRIAAVAVGCAPMGNPALPENMEKLFGRFPQIQGFYCQGGLDYQRMGPLHRAMMAVLRMSLRGKPEMAEMLRIISASFDGAKREYLLPVSRWAAKV